MTTYCYPEAEHVVRPNLAKPEQNRILVRVSAGPESSETPAETDGHTVASSDLRAIGPTTMKSVHMGLSTYIAEEFSKHPEVLAVLAGSSAHVMHVWLIVRESTRQPDRRCTRCRGGSSRTFLKKSSIFTSSNNLRGTASSRWSLVSRSCLVETCDASCQYCLSI